MLMACGFFMPKIWLLIASKIIDENKEQNRHIVTLNRKAEGVLGWL